MTNQEAIKLLNMGRLAYNEVEAEAFCEAYDMAIEALKAEPCTDCVSRELVIDYLLSEWNHELKDIVKGIRALPSVTPEQKIGRWIMSEDGLYRPICNKCGAHPWKGYIPTTKGATEVFKYCPNCGARMEGEA